MLLYAFIDFDVMLTFSLPSMFHFVKIVLIKSSNEIKRKRTWNLTFSMIQPLKAVSIEMNVLFENEQTKTSIVEQK